MKDIVDGLQNPTNCLGYVHENEYQNMPSEDMSS